MSSLLRRVPRQRPRPPAFRKVFTMPTEIYDATQRNPIEDISRAYSQNLSVDNQRGIAGYMERQIVSPIPFLPALDVVFDSLDKAPLKATDPRSSEIARDASNAGRQLPGLMEKSGARAAGRDGLTQADLDKLSKDRTLTADERAAVKYMRENYAALQTKRALDQGGVLGGVSSVVGDSRITARSLERNAGLSKPTGGEVPPPEDPAGRVANRPARPTEKTNPRDHQSPRSRADVQPAADFSDTKVQAWKGPWSVAEKMLKGQNLDGKAQMELTKVLKDGIGLDWNKSVREGTELINEQNLETVRKAIEQTRNPQLLEWFNKRYPKR